MLTKRNLLLTTLRQETKNRKAILADSSVIDKVDELAKKLDISTRTKALQFLTKFYEESQHGSSPIPTATFGSIMSNGNQGPPIVIAGIPGSGKSYALDLFLRECSKCNYSFVLFSSRAKDPRRTEHAWISNALSYYEFPTMQWLDSPGQYRVELETDLNLRRQQMRDAAQSLLRLEGDERLANWIIVVEEAADYYDVRPFCTFLRRMRKSTRRIVILSTEAELFKMCKPMVTLPR